MSVKTQPFMRFSQLDSITEIVPGKLIRAQRKVSADEDFLRDHFPLFAVLPGVLMLEALYQASCWLIGQTTNFECSVLYLAEAKNVKFADFVGPDETLDIECELLKQNDETFSLKCQGTKGDTTAVSARLVIAKSHCGLGGDDDRNHDRFVAAARREQFAAMFQPR
jgi:3-hydroxyacyl-[acyl-carrier-protein] dehydratase